MSNKKNKKSMLWRGGPRNAILTGLVLAASLLLLHQLTDYSRHIAILQYSAFLDKVEQDAVRAVYISGQEVRGVLKDGTHFETVVGTNPKDLDMLREHKVEIIMANMSSSLLSWYLLPFLLLLLAIGVAVWFFMRQSRGSNNGGSGGNIFGMGKSRAKMFMPSDIKETFNSVAGAVEAKEELHDVVDFLRDPQKYKKLGAKITRGVLLVGEPGNGKTLLARAVAGEANCPFFSISGSDFIEVFVGVGAARVRDLFVQARKQAPCIVFIDEIDAVGRQRGVGVGGGHDEREQTLNQLLTEMDGFEVNSNPVIVLAATNRADVLDKALLRPGRFDRRVDVPYPDRISREAILRLHARNVKLEKDSVDIEKIARGTPGFSGADLANLVNEAAINASKNNSESITTHDFEEARDKMILGKELRTIVLTDEDRKMIAYHEAGHALAGLLQPEFADPIHKVTIIPRGKSLGVTHAIPERDKHNSSKDEMLARVVVCLGGRAAEELVFGNYTTGAYSDFKSACGIIRNMICYYGMSDDLGTVVYGQGQDDFSYSQKTAEKIDDEVRRLTSECYAKVSTLLKDNRDKLELLAQELLEKETMYAADIYKLLGIEPRVDHRFS